MNQITIKTKEIEKLMLDVCKRYGLSDGESMLVIENYLDAELLRKSTHGISKFCFECRFFIERKGKPNVVVDTGPMLKLNGNKEVGPIAMQYCIELATQRAKKYGICIVGINNIQRYGILRTWVSKLLKQGLFGVVLNTCEPAMTGHNGKRKVLGTNPIAFPISTKKNDYIVDMATSKVAMSLIWQAQRENTTLPPNTFLDGGGNMTINPKNAKAVQNFGGIKGSSIALLLQLLSGSLFGFKMGSSIENMYDIGYVILVIDPSKCTSLDSMLEENTKLIKELVNSGADIPGSRSSLLEKSSELTLYEDSLKELQKLGETKNES